MKLAIIGLLAVVLLGGGGAAAYFFFLKPAEASAGPTDEIAKAEHEAKEGAAEEAAAKEEFVQLDPLILPIIGEDGVTETVSLVVSLEVPDASYVSEVKRLSPRLKDAFIQDMYGALNRKGTMKDGMLQIAPIKARLNKISQKVLGAEKVNDVLLQVVQQRPI